MSFSDSHVVMNINEKKYGLLAESLRRRTTSYDMIRRAASKLIDDVLISAWFVVRRRAQCEYSGWSQCNRLQRRHTTWYDVERSLNHIYISMV
jgi:hypothetical protein